MELKDLRMPSTRTWVIISIISVSLIVTLGIGLALGGGRDDAIIIDSCPPSPRNSLFYNEPSTSTEGHYSHAASAADSPFCATLGSMTMEVKGGSAMDAAISTIVCLGVIHPHSSGIGGGNFITYYKRDTKEMQTVIGREQAPSGVTTDMHTEAQHTSPQTGGKSIGVPGEVLGLYEAWKLGRSGRLTWKQLFGPAIKVCNEGFYVGHSLLHAINNTNLDEVPTAFKEFITNPATGEIYKEGDKMYRPQLAQTLASIADDPYAFYNGSLADNITLDITEAGGIITKEDLVNYTAPVKPAIKFCLSDNLCVHSPPPPSGGVVYQYILNILSGYEMDTTSVSTDDKALETVHRIIEAFKHAFSLRSELGDIDEATNASKTYVHQLVTNMTTRNYGELTRELINDKKTYDHAHYHQKYENVWDKGGSHYSVVGPNGDAVAITSTINLDFGSKVIGSRTGIVFNNQMNAFSKLGANHKFPGKRPLSSMSPSIVVDGHGDAKLVIGASGGPKIITATALVTMETLWLGWGIKEAIDYHRMHNLPDELGVEDGFPQVLIDGLKRMGHNVVVHPKASSVVQGITRTGSKLSANSDYRKGGDVHGYI